MQGIYKITNMISGHAYIGQSVDIERRFANHANAAKSAKQEYDYALYRAIRKYGIENFSFDVLEEVPLSENLDSREIYWIAYYDTFNNGYNETLGGSGVRGKDGEKHHNHKLLEADVIDIRRRYAACQESVQDIFESYSDRIEKHGFKKIYTWQTWKNVLPELHTEQVVAWHRENARKLYSLPGEKNPRSKLSDLQVAEIRMRKANGEPLKQIYKDFEYTGITFESFRNRATNYIRARKVNE